MSSSAGKMVGVILAAGRGTRMYPFSESLPKPILPVCNQPLLEYQIQVMRACGLSDVFVVIGYRGASIVSALGDGSRQGVSLRYVEQTDTLGLAHAVGKLEPYIECPFLLTLGDIYFVAEELQPAMAEVLSGKASANLLSRVENDPEMIKRNFAIIEDSAGCVRQVIEKPRYVDTRLKGVGLYVFDQHIFDAIRRTPRTAMRDEYEITDSIQILIDDGYVVKHRPVVRYDLNLTEPEDLLAMNLMDLARRGLPTLIGTNVEMPDGTRVENSVIGDGARLRYPICIRNSLIFRGARVDADTDLDSVIVETDTAVQCRRRTLAWNPLSATRS